MLYVDHESKQHECVPGKKYKAGKKRKGSRKRARAGTVFSNSLMSLALKIVSHKQEGEHFRKRE